MSDLRANMATLPTRLVGNGILDAGEGILWQGQPDGRFTFGLGDSLTGLFGFFFAAFALFWMVLAAQAGGFFWAFGLLHFSVGVALAVGGPIWRAYRLRRTWYTLTDPPRLHRHRYADLGADARRLSDYRRHRADAGG